MKKFLRTILTYADEAHHVPADTYQKVMNHFTPKLWLGMTATPDKRDDNMEGRNVYELLIIRLLMRFDYSKQWRKNFSVHSIILELQI